MPEHMQAHAGMRTEHAHGACARSVHIHAHMDETDYLRTIYACTWHIYGTYAGTRHCSRDIIHNVQASGRCVYCGKDECRVV